MAIYYGLMSATQSDGDPYLIGATADNVYSILADTNVDITGSNWESSADRRLSGGILTGFAILNDTANPPQYIAIDDLGTGTLADLPNWPASTTCAAIRPWKYFLVAGNMVEGGTSYRYKLRWSNSAVPGALPTSWAAIVSNDAGSVDLSADDGEIVDMVPFGDQLVIMRRYGLAAMRYIGGTDATNRLVMSVQRIPVGSGGGCLALNCAVEVPNVGIVAMSESDVYVFNGQNITSVIDKKLRRWLFSNIDDTNKRRSFLLHSAADSEVWVCVPQSGDTAATIALCWNYVDNTWHFRSLPHVTAAVHTVISESFTTWATISGSTWATLTESSWADFNTSSGSVRKTVMSSEDTDNQIIYAIGNADDANGSVLTALIERDYLPFGDPQRVKYIRRVWPRFDGGADQEIGISVGTSLSVNEPVSWQAEQTFTIGTSRKVDVNRSGRFIGLKIRSTSGAPWKIRSLDIEFENQGMW